MPFVSYSSQHVVDSKTTVSNVFMNEYLPSLSGECVRVYLYGLYLCSSATRYDNTLEHFANTLGLTVDDIIGVFAHLEDLGLVQVLKLHPIEIKYLPLKSGYTKIKKYKSGKYDEFNAQIQAVLDGRMISSTEFSDYYMLIESLHIEPDALVLIAKYCADLRGNNVGGAYVQTVAKNWAYAGVRTVDAVRERLETEAGDKASVLKVLKALGSKKTPEPEDYELWKKWRNGLGFSEDVILFVAKKVKGSVMRLDAMLLKYFEMKLFEKDDIINFEERKSSLVSLAREINKKIGVYYENVESVIEQYITNWQLKGFDNETLVAIAGYCFKSGIRTLDGMDKVVNKFFKQGITSTNAVDEFVASRVNKDKEIKEILVKLGLSREVTTFDRDVYSTWTTEWNFSSKIIEYGTSLSHDKTSPMGYLNRILANWHAKNVTTVEMAKQHSLKETNLPNSQKFIKHSYSDGELNRVFAEIIE
ncbi:MAG: DnaD domain protein [Firmicutes bacterium]|nr:DnaD domain protein [Bacillota bacterium]